MMQRIIANNFIYGLVRQIYVVTIELQEYWLGDGSPNNRKFFKRCRPWKGEARGR